MSICRDRGNYILLRYFILILLGSFIYPFSTFADNKMGNMWQNEIDQIVQIQSDRERLIKDMKRRMLILQNRFDQLLKSPQEDADFIEQKINKQPISSPKKRIEDGFPQVEQMTGVVSAYDKQIRSFKPVAEGVSIKEPTLFTIPAGGDLIVSFPGKIAARVGENSRIVIGPAQNNRIEVNLKNGTVSALLDPNRDKENGPVFAIRTKSGVTEATGTFYAVTEYKGQAYAAVKKGQVKKETVPPSKPDFSAYLKKAPAKVGMSSRK
jgi:hypothetical protein